MNKNEPTAMERAAKSFFELTAMRGSALALNQSDYEVTKRLEAAYDQITLMLELLHDQSSTETLNKICTEIDRLIEKLGDTVTIARLVIRERELELKLSELDKKINPGIKERIIQTFHTPAADELIGDMDPETRQRIEERLQLESLVDSLYTSEAAERVKKMLKKEFGLKTVCRGAVGINVSRPYRDLDAQVPTSRGEGYELPDIRTDSND
jgi:hypothetical protein